MCKTIFEIIVWLLIASLFVLFVKEIIYPRIVYGPPCEYVAANKVVCFSNWPK